MAGSTSPFLLWQSVHRRYPKCPPGGARTSPASGAPRPRASPLPPVGVGVVHSNMGPADRWRSGDLVPGVGCRPGVGSVPDPLSSGSPAQALFSPLASHLRSHLRCSKKKPYQTPFVQYVTDYKALSTSSVQTKDQSTVCPAERPVLSQPARPHPIR